MSDNGNGKLLTIREASNFSGMSIPALYKHIKRGIISVEYDIIQGKKIKKVKKEELIRVYGTADNTVEYGRIPDNIIEYDRISDIIRENIKQALETEKTQLIKPLEDHALYRLGRMEKEVEDLRAEKEILLQELDRYKALPGPIEEITEKLEQTEKEKSDLASSLEISRKEKEEMSQALQMTQREKEELRTRTESVMKAKDRVLADRENTVQTLKQQAEELEKEKERLMTDMTQQTEELLSQKEKEMAELQEKLKEQFEKQTEEIAAAWRRELEAERSRPWWKRIFGG